MPISESDCSYDEAANEHDDLDHRRREPTSSTAPDGRMMSKAELRKTHKPIMEKRRRAKINNCLNEIKDLLLSAMKKDPERHSKLEKADILEMAVRHLKSVQKQQKEAAARADPGVATKYRSGYLECVAEVSSFVDRLDDVDAGLKRRLGNHLHRCADGGGGGERARCDFASSSLLASFAAQSRFRRRDAAVAAGADDDDDDDEDGARIELIPRCLPNGDFAFLVPKASFSSMLTARAPPAEDGAKAAPDATRPSAFVAVVPRTRPPLSPPVSPETRRSGVIRPKAAKPDERIRNIKFPINTSAKKEHEPLCIITNVGERHRHAQKVDETRHLEENRHCGPTGENTATHKHQQQPPPLGNSAKRKADHADGLLALAPVKYPRMEIPDDGPTASAFKSVARDERFDHFVGHFGRQTIYECISDDESDDNAAEKSPQDEDRNEPMWRPW